CHYIRECPFYIARKEIESADVVVANHALVMAALETESVLPNPKELLLVLDEGHHLPEVARDALEIDGEITALSTNLQLDMIVRQVEQC
ncbi:ATP-dependent DNA helicase DinG, partial [Klebsiella pneumoniae]